MFGFHQKQGIKIVSPVNGSSIDICQVKDEVFAKKMIGDGIAIIPADGNIVCPINGTVTTVIDSCHALSLKSEEGIELIIHIGIDTVKLQGRYFMKDISEGDSVRSGDLLIHFDKAGLEASGYDSTVILIILPDDKYTIQKKEFGQMMAGKTTILTVKRDKGL